MRCLKLMIFRILSYQEKEAYKKKQSRYLVCSFLCWRCLAGFSDGVAFWMFLALRDPFFVVCCLVNCGLDLSVFVSFWLASPLLVLGVGSWGWCCLVFVFGVLLVIDCLALFYCLFVLVFYSAVVASHRW